MSEPKANEIVLENSHSSCTGRYGRKAVACYWFYGVLIAAAEIIVAYENVNLGFFLHLLLLGALLGHSAVTHQSGTTWLYLVLTMAPLTRVLSLSMPLADIPLVFWYMAIGIPLFAAAVGVARMAGYKATEIGLNKNNLPVQFLIALIGFPLGFIEYLILRPVPIVSSLSPAEIWFPALVLLIFTGLLEELVFRGIMYRAALEAAGKVFAFIYVSFIFAVLHMYNLSMQDILLVFLVGLLFTRIFVWQQSIVGLTLAHGITNITLFIIYPLIH